MRAIKMLCVLLTLTLLFRQCRLSFILCVIGRCNLTCTVIKLCVFCVQLLEQQEELHSLMNAIFKGVFVHRYRDRVPEIRALCMAEMKLWLSNNPAAFLNDGYLKYLGWMLHDKVFLCTHPYCATKQLREVCRHLLIQMDNEL